MSRLISILVIALALWGGWHLFQYYQELQTEKEGEQKQAAAQAVIPEQLPGLPKALEPSLRVAYDRGARGMRTWLRAYGKMVKDPRKAWIELDYCVAVARDDPAEARRIFEEVKKRTSPPSPVRHRVKQLEKTFE